MRAKIVAGNWKMNTSVPEGKELIEKIAGKETEIPGDISLIVAPPATHLATIAEITNKTSIGLSAQNCSEHESGAYTGEISANMIKSIGAEYTILGHSERRQYFAESDQLLLDKVKQAQANELTPIFCCGEVLEERESNKHFEVIKSQLNETIFKLDEESFKNIIIAYEPVWAIGTGKTASPEQAQEIHAFIRNLIADNFNQNIADETSILYGGSCKPGNAKEIFAQADVDGGLIGGASLKAEDFIEIAKSF